MKEEDMIRKLRAGNQHALRMLMDCYIPYVSAIVWNILRMGMTREDAEEVVSDVFLAAWHQAEDLRPGQVKQWLGAVARNKAKNALRKIHVEVPLEEDILEIADEITPASRLEDAEEQKLVQEALRHLPDTDREVFFRHYYFFQSVAEISRCMNMNESTVKTKLRRGRMRLKEWLTRQEAL